MKQMLQRGLAIAGSLAVMAAPLASSAAVTTAFNAGDLIKGSGSAVYYFASNGKRYVFPNEKTYFTWYANFTTVKQIPDGSLQTIPIGGNVTYRPGVKMLKVTTDPRTYAVDQGGVLRHVGSEQLAQTLYGLNWKQKIEDLPDAFFVNYRIGTALEQSSQFVPTDVQTATVSISQDKQMDLEDASVSIGTVVNGFVPKTITVKRGATVTWTNRDIAVHNVTFNTGGFASGDILANGTYSRRFDTVGSYDYRCTIHPSMIATVNVVQ